jgi:uncharacterized protein (TIGR00297 family)
MGGCIQRYASPKMKLRAQEQPGTAGDGGKLRWQSWLVLAAAAPWCAVKIVCYAATTWTGATQTALLISLALAFLVWLARAATPLAAVAGGLFTAVLTLAPQPGGPFHSGLPSLLTLFLLTWGATRFGRSKKQQLGVAEDQRGRNAAQVAANLGVAGLGAAAALTFPPSLFGLVVVAALAEATADTLASELGEVLGGRPLMVTSLRRVSVGTDGAISLVGTLAGTSGAVLLVLVAALTLRLKVEQAVCAVLGAIAGLFVDSLLGATAERRGWLNNDAVNFLSTLAAALIAMLLANC